MILLEAKPLDSLEDIQTAVLGAIELEFATLPPYLYAKFSIPPGQNVEAFSRIDSVIGQEMIHMCLACNIMNAIGGSPNITAPVYPGYLPGDVAKDLLVGLLKLSPEAMQQAMAIEEPEEPIDPPQALAFAAEQESLTIGQYYAALDAALAQLPASAWDSAGTNQIGDAQYFQGQLFPVCSYADAHSAITKIVSEGEGTPVTPGETGSPLDFQNELAHYYRFWEVEKNQVLTKADNPVGYAWAGTLGVDWNAVYPAIDNPGEHDFSGDPPAAQAAQAACNQAFTAMVDALNQTFNGAPDNLGVAVRAMFELRMAAMQALQTPLADGQSVAGPAFLYQPNS